MAGCGAAARMSKPAPVAAQMIRDQLKSRYSGDEWFLRFEVPNAAGFGGTGYGDAIAMNMWPSRGLVVHGFEIKVNRRDWLAELRNPEKSEKFFLHVDMWWLVAPKHIVHEGELPDKWGFIAATPKSLRMVKQAPRIEHDDRKLDRHFVAAMIRHPEQGSSAYSEALADAVRAAEAQKDIVHKQDTAQLRKSLEELQAWQSDFEATLGMTYSTFKDPKETADLVAATRRFLEGVTTYTLDGMERSTESILTRVKELRKALRNGGAIDSDDDGIAQ